MKIKIKLILLIVITMILSTLFFTLNIINSQHIHLKHHIENLKKEVYKVKREELLNYSQIAIKVIDSYYEKTKKDKIEQTTQKYVKEQSDYLLNILNGYYKNNHNKINKKQLKKEILEIAKNTRYGKNGYFWINDTDAKMIMHPIKPQLVGKNLINLKDPKGTFVFKKILKAASKRSGVIKYYWSKPGSKIPVLKVGYVQVFKPYNLIVGTGVYVDDVTSQMQQKALNAIKSMRYGKNGYFWINDMENKMLMHPIKPQYDNKIFINTPKVPFVELGTKKLKQLNSDKAFIEYSFYTPATKKYSHKLSIVRKFKPWNWVIGTGTYTDYLDMKINKEIKKAQDELHHTIIQMLLIAFVILVIAIFSVIRFMENIIIEPLDNFQQGLNKFFKFLNGDLKKVDKLLVKNNDEIGLMSQKTNEAIEVAVQTHNELLDLRKQLEKKVEHTTNALNKTQEEFNVINQATKESLEYGAMIQTSILPTSELINSIFTNHKIFTKYNDLIHSKFYIIEPIRNNEYVFALLDTKQSGIKCVFSTMLINAILKQLTTQFNHQENEDISPSWILQYLNENIDNLENGFDGAIVYYNKNTNILKYSGANIAFYYLQDNLLNNIHASTQVLGMKKNISYEEHIIEIKEYIEFFLSTNQDLQAQTSKFISQVQIDTNYLKQYLKTINDDIIIASFQINNKPEVIIEYEGKFTQELVNKYIEEIEDKIDNLGLMSNITTNFAEQFQNILNYGKSNDINIISVVSYGYIKLQKNSTGTYSIETQNILTLADKQKIEPKLIEIKSLDRNGIRKKYRELRKSGANTHEKGGGIGFYEIAKRCSKVEFDFTQINDDRFEFKFISFVESKK